MAEPFTVTERESSILPSFFEAKIKEEEKRAEEKHTQSSPKVLRNDDAEQASDQPTEPFDPASFVAQAQSCPSGFLGFLLTKEEARELGKDDLENVLRAAYPNHIEDARKGFGYESDGDVFIDYPLRTAYVRKMRDQRVFEYLVCSSLLAINEAGHSLVQNENLLYEPAQALLPLVEIGEEFTKLRSEVERSDVNSPWIKDCIDTFGKEGLSKWIDSQRNGLQRFVSNYSGPSELCLSEEPELPNFPKAATPFETFDYENADAGMAIGKLDRMVGLDEIKRKTSGILTLTVFDRVRKQILSKVDNPAWNNLGQESSFNHFVLVGNPGTGKTTYARILGEIFSANGVLPAKKATFCSGKQLIATIVGGTELNIQKLFENGRGGLIIIDEIDSLIPYNQSETGTSFDSAAIKTINALIGYEKDNNTGTIVVITGYKEEIERLFSANDGLKSRFPNQYEFEDYDGPALEKILKGKISALGYSADQDVIDLAMQQVLAAKSTLGNSFANARTVETLSAFMVEGRAAHIGIERLEEIEKSDFASEDALRMLTRFEVSDVPVFDPQTGSFKPGSPNRPQVATMGVPQWSNPPPFMYQ